MVIPLELSFQRSPGIQCRGLLSEKLRPHIVINTGKLEAFGMETLAGFRADQPSRTGNDSYIHNLGFPSQGLSVFRRRIQTRTESQGCEILSTGFSF
jgi:hypothetical protein